MLHDQGLPLHLWVEACNTAVYVQNHCPHKILGMSTPEEAYSGNKPDISHFRIFGSPFYMNVMKNPRKKLEPTVEVGIFVGYTDTPYNYRVYLNSAWEIVPRPEGKLVVGSRWIYKVKQAADRSVEMYKARFVARGFSQIEGIDYEDTFAPVTRYSSIEMILALSAQMGWHIHQMDVKTAFLNGVIEEEVYIE
eukprot:PITA_13269